MKDLTEMLKGVLEGVVLQKIHAGETYGYEITKYLNDLGFDEIVEGTVYTILVRIEKKGLVEIEKKKSELGFCKVWSIYLSYILIKFFVFFFIINNSPIFRIP